MAAHSSILAWRIPQTEKPGRLQFMVEKNLGVARERIQLRLQIILQHSLIRHMKKVLGIISLNLMEQHFQIRYYIQLDFLQLMQQLPCLQKKVSHGLRDL